MDESQETIDRIADTTELRGVLHSLIEVVEELRVAGGHRLTGDPDVFSKVHGTLKTSHVHRVLNTIVDDELKAACEQSLTDREQLKCVR
jgi:hypothetical protein